MNAIEKFDSEIAQLQAAVTAVEHARLTIAERAATAAADLRRDEELYWTRGPNVTGAHPAETAHLQRRAERGWLAAAGVPLLKTERQRIEREGEGLAPPISSAE